MAKFFKATVLLLVLAIASCNAEAPRNRNFRRLSNQRRFLARQEAAPTPYPSAAELKPEVAFEEAIAAQEPDLTYGPPAQTYGPPDVAPEEPAEDDLPLADEPEEFAPPAEAEEFGSAEVTTQSAVSSRLTSRLRQRQSAGSRKQQISSRLRLSKLQQRKRVAKAQRLTAVPVASLVAAPAVPVTVAAAPLQAQRFFVVNQPFAYSAQFQSW